MSMEWMIVFYVINVYVVIGCIFAILYIWTRFNVTVDHCVSKATHIRRARFILFYVAFLFVVAWPFYIKKGARP